MIKNKNRPKYLNLIKISMPVMAVASIAHRISGVLLVVAIPALVYSLELSISSPEGFAQVAAFFNQPLLRVVCVVLAWAIAHHFACGIRILLIDIDVGVSKLKARVSAWMVHVFAVSVMVLAIGVVL